MIQKLSIGIIGGGGWLAQTMINTLLSKGVVAPEQLGVSYRSKALQSLNLGVMTRGSGPAFPSLLAHALATDAIKHGIPPAIAERAVHQLLVGTGRLMENDPKPMADIVREFVEYRGVIASAITGMEKSGFGTSVENGLEAAIQKVRSLAN